MRKRKFLHRKKRFSKPMSISPIARRAFRLGFAAVVSCALCGLASAAERKLEARLIWGTNDEKSPNASHKKLEGEMAKKLGEMPFKWKNYFEVNRQSFS